LGVDSVECFVVKKNVLYGYGFYNAAAARLRRPVEQHCVLRKKPIVRGTRAVQHGEEDNLPSIQARVRTALQLRLCWSLATPPCGGAPHPQPLLPAYHAQRPN